jgi:mannose-6-phosphate isomerase-like protein (cupin superfamily)
MADRGDVISNPVTGQHMTFLATAADTGGELVRAEGVFPPGGFAGVEHIHPHQHEHFEVTAGQAGFIVDDERRVLGAGEAIDVPAGTSHTFWNAGEQEMRVIAEFRPGLMCTERFYERYFGFAQEGRVNAEAMPGLLDIATVWREVAEHAVLAKPPVWLQHGLFRMLSPIARLTGHRPPSCVLEPDAHRRDGRREAAA